VKFNQTFSYEQRGGAQCYPRHACPLYASLFMQRQKATSRWLAKGRQGGFNHSAWQYMAASKTDVLIVPAISLIIDSAIFNSSSLQCAIRQQ